MTAPFRYPHMCIFLPPIGRHCIRMSRLLQEVRGSGKTFWWRALQRPTIQSILPNLHPRLSSVASAEIKAGFGPEPSNDDYPEQKEIDALMDDGVEPQEIWRAVHARHLALPCAQFRYVTLYNIYLFLQVRCSDWFFQEVRSPWTGVMLAPGMREA